MKNTYFKNLDIIRFVAAFMIVVVHGFEAWLDYYVRFRFNEVEVAQIVTPGIQKLGFYFSSFGIGVEAFFLLSGFLITLLLLHEKNSTGKISIGKFWMRRILRIWPIYFIIIALGPFLTYWLDIGNPNYLPQFLFYNNYDTIVNNEWQFPFAHYWSIAIEEQFYLIWPLVLIFIPINKLKVTFFVIIVLSAISRFYFYQFGENVWMNMQLNTLCRMDTLVLGSFIGVLFFENKLNVKISTFLFFGMTLILFTSFYFEVYAEIDSIYQAVFKKYLYLIPLIVILIYFIKTESKGEGVVINLLRYLGKISYGIYVFHNVLVVLIIKRVLINNEIYSWTLFFILYPLSVIILSIISYELIERPILKLKKHFK